VVLSTLAAAALLLVPTGVHADPLPVPPLRSLILSILRRGVSVLPEDRAAESAGGLPCRDENCLDSPSWTPCHFLCHFLMYRPAWILSATSSRCCGQAQRYQSRSAVVAGGVCAMPRMMRPALRSSWRANAGCRFKTASRCNSGRATSFSYRPHRRLR